MTVYRISNINGRFDHVRGKRAAVARAIEMIDYPARQPLAEINLKDYGIRIERVSPAVARSVGLDA